MADVTRILNAINGGDTQAADQLLPLVYEELRFLASQKMAQERPGQTLQATALVHEAYLRLVGDTSQPWESRGHFFAAAAEAMRRILVENARRRKRLKRGGNHCRIDLNEVMLFVQSNITLDDLLALDEALNRLAEWDQTKAELVKLRFFGGLTGEQAAKVLGIARSTAAKHWEYARVWLRLEMSGGMESGQS